MLSRTITPVSLRFSPYNIIKISSIKEKPVFTTTSSKKDLNQNSYQSTLLFSRNFHSNLPHLQESVSLDQKNLPFEQAVTQIPARASKTISSTPNLDALPENPSELVNHFPPEQAEIAYKALFKPTQFEPSEKIWWIWLLGGYSKRRILEKSAFQTYEYTNYHTEKNSDLYEAFGIERNFIGWYTLTALHVWMIQVRCRLEGVDGVRFAQFVFNMFWQDLESRIIGLGITNVILLGRELRRLANSFFGMSLALDEGLLKGDAMLADAIWRDLFFCKDVDTEVLKNVLQYVRKELQQLDQLKEEDFLFKGYVQWGRAIRSTKESNNIQ